MPGGSISSSSTLTSGFSGMMTVDIVSMVSRRQLMSMSDREISIISAAIQAEVMKNPKIQEILAEKVKGMLDDM